MTTQKLTDEKRKNNQLKLMRKIVKNNMCIIDKAMKELGEIRIIERKLREKLNKIL